MRKNKKKSKKRKSSFLCHLWNGIIIVLPRSILVRSNGQSYSGSYSRTCSQHSRTFNQSYFPFSYSKRNNRTSYFQYRTSYLNHRTVNYRTQIRSRTLHSRTISDTSQPWPEVKISMQSKRNKAIRMPDIVLCQHDSYSLTETFSHTKSCRHKEKYDPSRNMITAKQIQGSGK